MLQGSGLESEGSIFIDFDNNSKTGYIESTWTTSGLDYLISNGHLFSHSANDNSWNWKDLGTTNVVVPESKMVYEAKDVIIMGTQTRKRRETDRRKQLMKKSIRRIVMVAALVIVSMTTIFDLSANIVSAKVNSSDMEDMEKQMEEALKRLDELGDIDFDNMDPSSTESKTNTSTDASAHASTIETDMMIATGDSFILGLKTDGTVLSTGISFYGADQVSDWTNITVISCGFNHSVGLKSNGTVVAVGTNSSGECDVENWKDIKMIAAGLDFTLGLKKNGTVVATGSNDYGKIEVEAWKDMISIAAGSNFTAGLKSDGTVLAIGKDCAGILDVSDWTDIASISVSFDNILGLKKDGTVVNTMRSDTTLLKDAISISASAGYAAGLKKDGTVITNTDTVNTSTWKDIIAISASGNQLVGLKKDGTVVVTAANDILDMGQCDVTGWKLKVVNDIKTTTTNYKILVNGTKSTIETYTIQKNIYIHINDLAYLLKGTKKKFAVTGDGIKTTIKLTSKGDYKATGSEIKKSDGKTRAAIKKSINIYIDGKKVKLTAYKINGKIYFNLDDVMQKLNIKVSISEKNSIIISTKKDYVD